MEPKKIIWVIKHKPEHLFFRTAKAFAEQIEKALPGHFELEVLRTHEYVDKYNKYPELRNFQDVTHNPSPLYKHFWQALENGDIMMSQFQAEELSQVEPKMYALVMPYIFDDHNHVSRTIEGEIGDELRAGITKGSGMKSLAFTYSGGYRVFGRHKPIDSMKDVKKVATSNVFLADVIKNTLGAETNMHGSYVNNQKNYPNDEMPVVESTYLRFPESVKHIYKTNHSIFLTNIVISKKFWATLTTEEQNAIEKAAFNTARVERKWSLDDAEDYEFNSFEHGRIIKEMTAEEGQEFKKQSKRFWVKVRNVFEDKILRRIRKLSNKHN